MTIVTVPVEDLEEVMRLVEKSGRSVFERRTTIPSIGYFSTCTEFGGLIFGIVQADPSAH